MDIPLLIFCACVLFFSYRGYRNGLLASLSRVIGLLGGYLAAIIYSFTLYSWLQANTPLQGVLAYVIASLALLVGGGILVAFMFGLLAKLIPQSAHESSLSSIGGSLVGLAVGALIGLILVWSLVFLQDMRPDLVGDNIKSGLVEGVAKQVAGKAVNAAMNFADADPDVVKISAALASSPAEITQQFQRLTTSPELISLLRQPSNQAVLDSGDLQAIKSLPDFQHLMKNPDMLSLATTSGMLSSTGATNDKVEDVMAEKISDTWSRTLNMINDSRVQEILNDPEFQEQIEYGNLANLITDPRLMELAKLIFTDTNGLNDADL